MNVLVFGATGMVGIEVVHHCIEDERVTRVTCAVRRSTEVVHPKLTEVIHTDYEDYSALDDAIGDADMIIHCIGVYTGMLPDDEFWKITCDYFAALVQRVEAVHPDVTFCLFSAQGADPSEKSRAMFARAKGRAERMLTKSAIANHYIFRPGYIDPGRRQAVSKIPVWLARPFYRLMPFIGVDAEHLAAVMLETGLTGNAERVFENGAIRRARRR